MPEGDLDCVPARLRVLVAGEELPVAVGPPAAYIRVRWSPDGGVIAALISPSCDELDRLVLVDALRPMCNKGPQVDPRFKWDYGGLIAGLDPVAVETTCLRIIEAKREAIRGEPWPLSPPPVCVEAADKTYGLGPSDPAAIDVEFLGWEDDRLI